MLPNEHLETLNKANIRDGLVRESLINRSKEEQICSIKSAIHRRLQEIEVLDNIEELIMHEIERR